MKLKFHYIGGNVKCQIKFVERIDNNNFSNALNALMIRESVVFSCRQVETPVSYTHLTLPTNREV